MAQMIGCQKRGSWQIKSERRNLFAHVVIQTLAEGSPEAEVDANRVDKEEGLPLLLVGGDAQNDESQVPVGVGVL